MSCDSGRPSSLLVRATALGELGRGDGRHGSVELLGNVGVHAQTDALGVCGRGVLAAPEPGVDLLEVGRNDVA